jgi:AGCS family alanine or glycine:cation symporter
MNDWLVAANAILWHDSVLWVVFATGLVFTVWSGFSQYRALTHGVRVVRGDYDRPDDPGAISHFQALSAALSATVGLGNIGGVAIAVSLGGPGAVFWMWVVGFVGMAIKLTEVTLAMLYRNTDDPANPHGGSMWVVSMGLARRAPALAGLGRGIGLVFCVTLLISAVTGGNMFQAWNVADLTREYFGVPTLVSGGVLAALSALVIIGGIQRVGAVASRLVPVMIILYLAGVGIVLAAHWQAIPGLLAGIVTAAFTPTEASGAFLGGTVGSAFLFGMKRALFSNEAGQGSSPIAHAAARTDEPVREGVVAGLEPFVDTLVVCTLTALVILATGVWNRPAEARLPATAAPYAVAPGQWTLPELPAPPRTGAAWQPGDSVFAVVLADPNPATGHAAHRLAGTVVDAAGEPWIRWATVASATPPVLRDDGIFVSYVGATLTAKAFDSVVPGLGKWLVTVAVWLFAFSTIVSWNYYGEQGVVFMAGLRWITPYRVLYCLAIVVATAGIFATDAELDNLSGFGTGVMLFANIPILWVFGREAMTAYRGYIRRLDAGEFAPVRGRAVTDP